MAKKSKAQIRREQQEELRRWISIIITFALIVIGLLRSGVIGMFMYQLQRYLFGMFFWVILSLFIVINLMNVINRRNDIEEKSPAPMILIICGLLLLCTAISTDQTGLTVFLHYITNISDYFSDAAFSTEVGGGIIGAFLYGLTSTLFGKPGVVITIIVMFIIAALLMVNLDVYKQYLQTAAAFFASPLDEEPVKKKPVEVKKEPEPETEQPAPNFWIFLENSKDKIKSKFHMINADEPQEVTEPEVDIFGKQAEKPHMDKIINIKADQSQEEIMVVSIPGRRLNTDRNVFINIDDLYDEVGEANADTQEMEPIDETIYPPYEEEPQQDVVFEYVHPEPEAPKPSVPASAPSVSAPAVTKKPGLNTNYRIPSARLVNQMLDPLPSKDSNLENQRSAKEKGELLISILRNFDIEAELLDIHIGPSVTQFEIRPDATVKVSRILSLADNIKMALAAKDVRIEAPIPGRPAVGIEIPNLKSTPVKMKEIINDLNEKDRHQPLLFYVGKDLLGQTVTCRLDKMPHLLIAGATGSGKSVCMNAIITSLLLRTHPDDVKMLLIDPKKVEFTPYQKIPHLIGPVINDPNQANNALKAIVQIMDERYNIFAAAGVRNIQVYNEKVKQQNGRPNEDGSPAPKKMPYIVVIIDELADLMAVAGKEVELSIQRITQLARAAGIHLIVATQRPSVDVITGVIKANIPSRIAFAVSSGTDSRTILDHVGAERLLGNGDMLYMPIGQSNSIRVQGVFVTDEEVQQITDYCSSHGTPMYDDKFIMLEGVNDGDGGGLSVNDDPLYQEVKNYVIEAQKASTSLLQRRFGIGYNRAARMIDALESGGIIGPAQGSKPREVYAKPDHQQKRTETGEVIE